MEKAGSRMKWFETLGWCVVCCTLPAIAHAGVIRGTVRISDVLPASAEHNPYPGNAHALQGDHSATRGAPGDAVIYVERVAADVDSSLAHRPEPTPTLAQKGQMFVPRVLAIAVGSTVDFPNQDPIYHNVFSLSPIRRFDLGKYPRGHSKQVTFNQPGLVNVFCDIHSSMAAYILVLPHHAFAQADGMGGYRLPPLPAGHYVLHVWHPDVPGARREIDVPEQGDVVVDLTL